MWVIVILLVILAVLVALAFRHRDPARRSRALVRSGFGVMAGFTVLFGLFAAGETFDDPGGWEAAGLVAAWVAPLAVLALLAWRRPAWAAPVLAVLTVVVVGVEIWAAAAPEQWRAWEDSIGPVRAIGAFAVAAAVAVLGLARAGLAGTLLVVLGVVPLGALVITADVPGAELAATSSGVVASTTTVAGLLFLLGASMRRSRPEAEPGSPDEGTGPASAGGDHRPKAA